MCALFHHPLFGSGEKRQCELQLGGGCAGDDARLRGNDDVGEDGITKSVVTLVGACLFLIGAFLVFPAFFGYRI